MKSPQWEVLDISVKDGSKRGHHVDRNVSKRVFDLTFAILGLMLLLPLLILCVLLVCFQSPGPIFYRAKRVGRGGRVFEMYKFRTMVVNADSLGASLTAYEDSRITRVGRFLRRTKLDEIPQLFNVIRGEMSIIGPRPERPFFVEKLVQKYPSYLHRLSVKPGMTGFAQIHKSYDNNISDVRQKLEFDFFYIKYLNFILDLKILMKTVLVMISGKGR